MASAEQGQSPDTRDLARAFPFVPGACLGGRYRLLQPLPACQPPVYQAHDESLDRDVALYFVPPGQPDMVTLARDTAQINHPCFIRVFNLGVEERWTFIVAEWMEADTLAQLLERGYPAPPLVTVRVGLELAAAVEAAHAHAHALSHPPLTTQTVLFPQTGHVRLRPTSPDVLPPDHTLRDDVQALALLLRAMLTAGGALAVDTPLTAVLVEAANSASDVQRPAQLAARMEPLLSSTVGVGVREGVATQPLGSAGARPIQQDRLLLGQRRRSPVQRKIPSLVVGVLLTGLVVGLALFHPALRTYLAPAPFCSRGASPSFANGLAQLEGKIGGVMGTAEECPYPNPDNGDLLQQTSTGLAFAQKSTGSAIFTNGFEHWSLDDGTLVYWTGTSVDPPAGAARVPGLPGAVRPG